MSRRITHQFIADHLRGRIRTGSLKKGDKLPSFEQLNRQFGSSPNTIIRALDVLATDGLVERRPRNGVYVAENVPRTRAIRLGLIGADEHNFATDYWQRFLSGVHSESPKLKADLLIPHLTDTIDWSEFDGVIAYGDHVHTALKQKPAHLPLVAASEHMPGIASVCWNDHEAGYIAAQHLLDLGHRRIGYLGWMTTTPAILRVAGYRSALEFAKVPYDESLIRRLQLLSKAGSLAELGARNMESWLNEGLGELGCTALIVQNDNVALGVMESLSAHGYRIPADMSVIGFDNERDAAHGRPALTSVAVDMHLLGSTAVKSLMHIVTSDSDGATETLLPAKLFVRESTARPRT